MNFVIQQDILLKPLQMVISLFSRRYKLPILENILLQVEEHSLFLTGTDLEVEIVADIKPCTVYETGFAVVSARKFFDICRNLPVQSKISLKLQDNSLHINSSRSNFSLVTLPLLDFPKLDLWHKEVEFFLSPKILKLLIESTKFSMANQDVRYYLNGMLFETQGKQLRTVATDGHRLAMCTIHINEILPNFSIIVPRKGIIEMSRMLNERKNLVKLQMGNNNICLNVDNYVFTSKLIDGNFPDYHHIFPKNPSHILEVNCEVLKQACIRSSILANEKFHGIRFNLSSNQLKITTHNSKYEKSEEIIDVMYQNEGMEIGFNVNYILDVLNNIKCKDIRFLLTDSTSSVQLENHASSFVTYVIMPIRL